MLMQLILLQFLGAGTIVQAQSLQPELVYVHTDRNVYVSGETVFFKMLVVNQASEKFSEISKFGYILLRGADLNPVIRLTLKLENSAAFGSFYLPDSLKTGVYQLVGYTSWIKNFGEQACFNKEITIANGYDKQTLLNGAFQVGNQSSAVLPESSILQLKTDKPVYKAREKVSIDLSSVKGKGIASISVYEEPKGFPANGSITSYLDRVKAFGNDQASDIEYLPETKWKILRGRLVDAKTLAGISGSTVLLTTPDTIVSFQYATTSGSGLFMFQLSDYYNGKELYFTVKDKPLDKDWKIEIENDFGFVTGWEPKTGTENKMLTEFLMKSQDIVYVNKTYLINPFKTNEMVRAENPVCQRFYYNVPACIYPSDFVSLPDFIEIARELLPDVKIREVDGKYRAWVRNSSTLEFFSGTPVIFLDGVYQENLDQIMKMGSDMIRKIEILNTERIYGDVLFQGVISIFSVNRLVTTLDTFAPTYRIKNSTIHPATKLSDRPANQEKNTPDFRQLLYWNPVVEFGEANTNRLEFYTSDHTATYIMQLEGLTDDGRPVSKQIKFQVIN